MLMTPLNLCVGITHGQSQELGSSFLEQPANRQFNLPTVQPKHESMEQYIGDFLKSGIIRPPSSPLGAVFLFLAKKDKTLRPCIDYRGLNNITVKNKYPLPLINSAFEPLHGATVFSKLVLRNAYHLVWIKEGAEWKTVTAGLKGKLWKWEVDPNEVIQGTRIWGKTKASFF